MKKILKLSMLMGAIALASCQNGNDKDPPKERDRAVDIVKIADGMIQSPGWLADEVERLADQHPLEPHTGEKLYPWVYYVEHDGEDYILVKDIQDCYACGTHYFTLSGEPVDANNAPSPGLYSALENARRESIVTPDDKRPLWRYEYN